jgi:2-phosphosulfolactate phosphatase
VFVNVRLLSLGEGARKAEGLAIVIDVFRAFTCAPILFHLGVEKIIFVSKPEEGLALKKDRPELIMIGEVNAAPIEGYEFGNSPKQLLAREAYFFRGKTAVQRTSSGVQGALIALGLADPVLLAGYATARATADYVKRLAPATVSVIAMGRNMDQTAPEDELCARYIASMLGHGGYDHREAIRELIFSPMTQMFTGGKYPYLPAEDAIICLQRDVFELVIRAGKEDGMVVARPVGHA